MSENMSSIIGKLYSKNTNPKLGLDRVLNLIKLLGFKRENFLVVQVVGTNGKGSTVAFLQSLLLKNGFSTGLFTSPHLSSVRERIAINGHMVSEEDFIEAAEKVLSLAENLSDEPSFFECILAMALLIFQKNSIDVIILEAGLGGRLDATTAVKADILGISTIDFDHQQILGETLEKIAYEKAYAAQGGQTVVSVAQKEEALLSIRKAQKEIGFNLVLAKPCEQPVSLYGEHQLLNAGLSLAILKELGLKTSPKKNQEALLTTFWPGRFEIIKDEIPIVLDGAHNPSGMKALCETLKSSAFRLKPIVCIYGSMKSDNASKKVELLASIKPEMTYLHAPNNPRAQGFLELEKIFSEHGLKAEPFTSLAMAKSKAVAKNAILLITGSLYTVGELRAQLLNIEMDDKNPHF